MNSAAASKGAEFAEGLRGHRWNAGGNEASMAKKSLGVKEMFRFKQLVVFFFVGQVCHKNLRCYTTPNRKNLVSASPSMFAIIYIRKLQGFATLTFGFMPCAHQQADLQRSIRWLCSL